jgi:hypothetical protein
VPCQLFESPEKSHCRVPCQQHSANSWPRSISSLSYHHLYPIPSPVAPHSLPSAPPLASNSRSASFPPVPSMLTSHLLFTSTTPHPSPSCPLPPPCSPLTSWVRSDDRAKSGGCIQRVGTMTRSSGGAARFGGRAARSRWCRCGQRHVGSVVVAAGSLSLSLSLSWWRPPPLPPVAAWCCTSPPIPSLWL